jgi:hypothetical protein
MQSVSGLKNTRNCKFYGMFKSGGVFHPLRVVKILQILILFCLYSKPLGNKYQCVTNVAYIHGFHVQKVTVFKQRQPGKKFTKKKKEQGEISFS